MSEAQPAEVIHAPEGFDDGTAFEPEPAAPEVIETPAEPDPEPEPAAEPPPVAPLAAPDPQLGILRDLQGERRARQAAEQETARLRGQLEGIQMEQRRGPAQTGPTPLSAAETAKATTWAHRFGMYTADGQPDVIAANNALNELRTEFSGDVDARVQARVAPVVQVLQNAHAQAKVTEIVKIGSQYGADPALLQTYASNLAAVDPGQLDDQNVIVGLIALSRGMGSLANPTPAPAPRAAAPTTIPAPNLTESPGRRVTVAPSLSGIERTIASKRGMSNEKWATVGKEFEQMDPTRGLVAEKD